VRELTLRKQIAGLVHKLGSVGLLWLRASNISAQILEMLAATYRRARAIGEPHILSREEIWRVEDCCRTYGRPPSEPAA
jgi:hypothetical protein